MIQLQRPKRFAKKTSKGLVNPHSHVQKKYFSLMLVPSYSSGKTRSIRIPYSTFYVIFCTLVAIAAIVLIFYMQAHFYRVVAQDTIVSLEQAEAAYMELQELSELEQTQLLEESLTLRSELSQERLRRFTEQLEQQEMHRETLDSIQMYIGELELQLDQFELYRQEILAQLSASRHIPSVRNMLDEMDTTQVALMSMLEELTPPEPIAQIASVSWEDPTVVQALSYAVTNPSPYTTAEELFDRIDRLEARLNIKAEMYAQLQERVPALAPYIRNFPTRRPAVGRVTSGFGWRRNPMGGSGSEMHNGIDIAARTGTNIHATGGGTVVFSGWSGNYGNKVIIDHGMGIRTWYAHNSTNLVRVGQEVSRGELIARVGSTGRSTGPHVHYEVRIHGVAQNPVNFFLE